MTNPEYVCFGLVITGLFAFSIRDSIKNTRYCNQRNLDYYEYLDSVVGNPDRAKELTDKYPKDPVFNRAREILDRVLK